MQTHAYTDKGKVTFSGYIGGNCEIKRVDLHSKAFGLIPRHRYIPFHSVLWDFRKIATQGRLLGTVILRKVDKHEYRYGHSLRSGGSEDYVGSLNLYVGKEPKVRRIVVFEFSISSSS
jgi:hypothetical protein